MLDPIGYQDYKAYLRDVIDANRDVRGYQGKLADAAACQRSFFSHVLRSEANLTPEQALRLATHWRLGEDETTYFLTLVDLGRTSYPPLARRLEARLARLAARRENLSARFKETNVLPADLATLYYSSWHWIAIHIVTSIPRFQTAAAIAGLWGLPLATVESTLATLHAHGLVARDGERWFLAPTHLHLPKDSPLLTMHHANWRARAALAAQAPGADGLHYTVVQSQGRDDFARVKAFMLEALDANRDLMRRSPDEEVVCLCLDVFRLT